MIFGLGNGKIILLELKNENAVEIWSQTATFDYGISHILVTDLTNNGYNEMYVIYVELQQQNQDQFLFTQYYSKISQTQLLQLN